MISILFSICKAVEGDSSMLRKLFLSGIECPKSSPIPRSHRSRRALKTQRKRL